MLCGECSAMQCNAMKWMQRYYNGLNQTGRGDHLSGGWCHIAKPGRAISARRSVPVVNKVACVLN